MSTDARGWFGLISAATDGGGHRLCLHHPGHHGGGACGGGHAGAAGLVGGCPVPRHGGHLLLSSPGATACRSSRPGRRRVRCCHRHQCGGRQLSERAGRLPGGRAADGGGGTYQAAGKGDRKDPGAGRRGHAGRRAAALYAGRSRGGDLAMPMFVLPLVVVFFSLRLSLRRSMRCRWWWRWALSWRRFGGGFADDCCHFGLTALVWTTPAFDLADDSVHRRAAVSRHHGLAESAGLRGAARQRLPAAGAAGAGGDRSSLRGRWRPSAAMPSTWRRSRPPS